MTCALKMETGLAIHHDRDSPGEASHHVSMDEEDSQDLDTTKKILKPLPDTQPSQPECPDNYQQASALHNGGLRLISRPHDTDFDPAASFTYGKPIKVTPGQFGRTVPPKISNTSTGESLDSNIPSVRGGLGNERPKAVSSDQAQPLSTAVPRKSPPFDDRQLQHSPSDSRDQLHRTSFADRFLLSQASAMAHQDGTKFSKTRFSPQNPHAGSRTRDSSTLTTQENMEHPQHYHPQVLRPSAVTAEPHEQKCRLSLPNDTSVSSPQVADHSPRNRQSHQTSQVNRPMRNLRQVRTVNTPAPRTASSRSSVHNSNISKKRSGNHASMLSTARHSRIRSPQAYDESPTRRNGTPSTGSSSRGSSSAQDHVLRQPCDMDNLAGGVVQSLNSLFITLKQKTKQKDLEMALMERRAQEQQSKLSKYKKQTEGSINIIQKLEQSHAQLQGQLAAANQQLSERSEKTLRLEEKCRQYKGYLNSAIAEQQELYKAANTKCEIAITQMRDSERKHKAMSEQERKQVEATRERLTQMVKSTITEYKFKEKQCEFFLLSIHV